MVFFSTQLTKLFYINVGNREGATSLLLVRVSFSQEQTTNLVMRTLNKSDDNGRAGENQCKSIIDLQRS